MTHEPSWSTPPNRRSATASSTMAAKGKTMIAKSEPSIGVSIA